MENERKTSLKGKNMLFNFKLQSKIQVWLEYNPHSNTSQYRTILSFHHITNIPSHLFHCAYAIILTLT